MRLPLMKTVVLDQHKAAGGPRWHLTLPTADDMCEARKAQGRAQRGSKDPDSAKEEGWSAFGTELLARCGLRCDELTLPVDLDALRLAIAGLPFVWWQPLVIAAQEEGEIDKEEE
jgi:hypothetical protein